MWGSSIRLLQLQKYRSLYQRTLALNERITSVNTFLTQNQQWINVTNLDLLDVDDRHTRNLSHVRKIADHCLEGINKSSNLLSDGITDFENLSKTMNDEQVAERVGALVPTIHRFIKIVSQTITLFNKSYDQELNFEVELRS